MEEQSSTRVETQTSNRPSVSFPGAPVPKKKNVGMKIGILVALLVVIGGIAWFLLSSENPFSAASQSPTPTMSVRDLPSNTPAPTESPVKKDELKVSIKNGTGVPGEAAFLQKEMEKLGFKSIESGNADNKNYTKTQVSFASRVPEDVKTEVSAKLQELYTGVEVSDTASAGLDITIITGLRKGQKAATPTTAVQGTKTSVTPTKAATTTGSVAPTGASVTATKAPVTPTTP
jgi:hypothetical protein